MENYLNKDISKIDFDIRKPEYDIKKLGVLNYKFNEENKKLFLEKIDKDIRVIMKKFLDITIHVSYETFTKKIKENLIQVLKNHYKPGINIFAYISEDGDTLEIKSSHWVYKYIEYFLKDLKITLIYSSKFYFDFQL
jgi:hypothetical protein